jgi:hypothetical protein
VADNFSLTQGGFVYRFLLRMGAIAKRRHLVVSRMIAGILLTWLPLLVLSLEEGLAYGNEIRIPFLLDIAANVRFLIALPLLITAETGIDYQLRRVVIHFVESGLVSEHDLGSFEGVLERVTRLRDRLLPEILMLALAYSPSLSVQSHEVLMTGASNWHWISSMQGETLSYAGWWFGLVSIPIFRFLLFRWVWRMLLWTWLLWRTSTLHLVLIPTHPDMAAGLGFLSEAQLAFGSIAFAGSAVIAAQVGNAIAYEGVTLDGLKFVIISYCVFIIILLLSPLLLMIPTLYRVRRRGLREYGVLASNYARMFDAKWVHGQRREGESLLGSPDIQSLADLNNSFAIIREMRIMPIEKRTLIGLTTAAVLPMVPVLILGTPAEDLIRTVLKLLA